MGIEQNSKLKENLPMAAPAVVPEDTLIIDPAHDLVGVRTSPLAAIFAPKSVAVVGASERAGSVGCTVLTNLMASPFGGPVWPVNPKRPSVLGLPAYKSIADLPGIPDLIVVTTPAATVPAIIQEAVDAGVPAGIIISAGFKEIGEPGKALERQIAAIIHGKMRIIGPNCLGVMNPVGGVNANFAKEMVPAGRLAFISQSGALGTAVLDWHVPKEWNIRGGSISTCCRGSRGAIRDWRRMARRRWAISRTRSTSAGNSRLWRVAVARWGQGCGLATKNAVACPHP